MYDIYNCETPLSPGIMALMPVRIIESFRSEKMLKILKPAVISLEWLKCEKIILPGMLMKKPHVFHFDKMYINKQVGDELLKK